MTVTLALDPDSGDLLIRGGSLVLLQGAEATAQNIATSLLTVAGTFGLNQGAGFPIDQVLTVGALDDTAAGSTSGIAAAVVRDHLRSSNGATGVAGVVNVIGSPTVTVDETLPGLRVTAVVLDETAIEIVVDDIVALVGDV